MKKKRICRRKAVNSAAGNEEASKNIQTGVQKDYKHDQILPQGVILLLRISIHLPKDPATVNREEVYEVAIQHRPLEK